MSQSSGMGQIAAVRGYASDVMSVPVEAIRAVSRFEDGNRHGVYRVSYVEASGAARDVVVRVSFSGDESEVAQAEREAAVLATVGGLAAPELYDFRRVSEWFDTPAMCMQFVSGGQEELRAVGLAQVGQLAVLVAWVHGRPGAGLGEGAGVTVAAYAEERLRAILATLVWARDPLPGALQGRLRRAGDLLAAGFEARRGSESFDSGESLALLHGDIGPGNVLWTPEPCLIDWEYARVGDPADEIAYTVDQNALTSAQRKAFWDGYARGMDGGGSRVGHIAERAAWWEPVTLLGSTLWWVERWVRRTESDHGGEADAGVPREAGYYFEHVTSRLERFERLDQVAGNLS